MIKLKRFRVVWGLGAATALTGLLVRLFARHPLAQRELAGGVYEVREDLAAAYSDIGLALLYAGLVLVIIAVVYWLFAPEPVLANKDAA